MLERGGRRASYTLTTMRHLNGGLQRQWRGSTSDATCPGASSYIK